MTDVDNGWTERRQPYDKLDHYVSMVGQKRLNNAFNNFID